jgi:hypothetical protein
MPTRQGGSPLKNSSTWLRRTCFPNDHLLAGINPVNLEYVLGDIQTDRGNSHVDGSPHVIRLRRTTLWHFDAESGRRPPHQERHFALQKNS